MSKKNAEAVKVVVRCRPLSKTELKDNRVKVVDMDLVAGSVRISKPGGDADAVKEFTFDYVFDESSTQIRVYEDTARPIVEAAMNGFNGTIFAYGQTGTGKTWTMEGNYDNIDQRGIIPNAFAHIFEEISSSTNKNFLVRASYLEIYNEEVRDLLSKNYVTPLPIKENAEGAFFVKGLSAFVVKSTEEIQQVMRAGTKNRVVGETKMNNVSSRSHSIFTITIECSEMGVDGQPHIRVGKLNLVDLAGSERQSKTEAEGARQAEGTAINLSLSALGNVVSALVDPKAQHVPYRDSKLTKLLMDSLGGNSKTVMIAAIGPADYNYDETVTTLRYADRAKRIKNKPKINEDPKDAMLRQFQEEIERLRAQLSAVGNGEGGGEDEGEDGEEDGGEGGSGGGGGGGGRPKRKKGAHSQMSDEALASMQAQIDAERAKMEEKYGAESEKKAQMRKELEAREAELERERQERAALAAKLQAMEEKVLVGGVSLIDIAERQEREIQINKAKMEQQALEEERLRQELQEKQDEIVSKQDKFSTLQEEVDIKTRKLKKLWNKLQAAKNEISDLEEEHARDKADLINTIRDQTRDLLLCRLIIDNFIPPEEVEKIRARAEWDDNADEYVLVRATYAGQRGVRLARPHAHPSDLRPTCEYSRVAVQMGANHARFKAHNILQLNLDGGERLTQDYTGPSVDPRLQRELDKAIAGDGDLTFVASENLPSVFSR